VESNSNRKWKMAKPSQNEIKKLGKKFDQLFQEQNRTEQPKGTITTKQYANHRGIVQSRAQSILLDLWKQGLVTRERWKCMYVYKMGNNN